ncbi:hypothetical protein B0H63DRAFT_19438 [Podospora didyma]|uniref:Uncharacterized protein n=1 Tax=Podospora didyma TaxID=330526 RepID=A0AAE0P5A1_9PEZI|nr:hypothetical protein B0H63DRAFT_19438 [Podospora didyma]
MDNEDSSKASRRVTVTSPVSDEGTAGSPPEESASSETSSAQTPTAPAGPSVSKGKCHHRDDNGGERRPTAKPKKKAHWPEPAPSSSPIRNQRQRTPNTHSGGQFSSHHKGSGHHGENSQRKNQSFVENESQDSSGEMSNQENPPSGGTRARHSTTDPHPSYSTGQYPEQYMYLMGQQPATSFRHLGGYGGTNHGHVPYALHQGQPPPPFFPGPSMHPSMSQSALPAKSKREEEGEAGWQHLQQQEKQHNIELQKCREEFDAFLKKCEKSDNERQDQIQSRLTQQVIEPLQKLINDQEDVTKDFAREVTSLKEMANSEARSRLRADEEHTKEWAERFEDLRKHMRSEIENLHLELARRMEQEAVAREKVLAAAMQELKKKLEEEHKARKDFIEDEKSPLHTILSRVTAMDGIAQMATDEAKAASQAARRAAEEAMTTMASVKAATETGMMTASQVAKAAQEFTMTTDKANVTLGHILEVIELGNRMAKNAQGVAEYSRTTMNEAQKALSEVKVAAEAASEVVIEARQMTEISRKIADEAREMLDEVSSRIPLRPPPPLDYWSFPATRQTPRSEAGQKSCTSPHFVPSPAPKSQADDASSRHSRSHSPGPAKPSTRSSNVDDPSALSTPVITPRPSLGPSAHGHELQLSRQPWQYLVHQSQHDSGSVDHGKPGDTSQEPFQFMSYTISTNIGRTGPSEEEEDDNDHDSGTGDDDDDDETGESSEQVVLTLLKQTIYDALLDVVSDTRHWFQTPQMDTFPPSIHAQSDEKPRRVYSPCHINDVSGGGGGPNDETTNEIDQESVSTERRHHQSRRHRRRPEQDGTDDCQWPSSCSVIIDKSEVTGLDSLKKPTENKSQERKSCLDLSEKLNQQQQQRQQELSPHPSNEDFFPRTDGDTDENLAKISSPAEYSDGEESDDSFHSLPAHSNETFGKNNGDESEEDGSEEHRQGLISSTAATTPAPSISPSPSETATQVLTAFLSNSPPPTGSYVTTDSPQSHQPPLLSPPRAQDAIPRRFVSEPTFIDGDKSQTTSVMSSPGWRIQQEPQQTSLEV